MRWLKHTFILLFIFAAPIQPALTQADWRTAKTAPQVPSPKLDPTEVVSLQVEALRANGPDNKGIHIIYRFASPDNKLTTGPIERFVKMVHSSPYDRLLNHRSAIYSPISIQDDMAIQEVTITDQIGEKVRYIWILSRQNDGALKDCWMTDAVITTQRLSPRKLV